MIKHIKSYLAKNKLCKIHSKIHKINSTKLTTLYNDDYFIVSFPRSGNTWMRYLLSDIALQNASSKITGNPRIIDNWPVSPHDLVPDLHIHNPESSIIKNYGFPCRVFKSHNITILPNNCRFAYLIRDPNDVMLSYARMTARNNNQEVPDQHIVHTFVEKHIDYYKNHMKYALYLCKKKNNNLIICDYNMTYGEPEKHPRRVLNNMNYLVSDKYMAQAVNNQSFIPLNYNDSSNKDDFDWEQAKPGISDKYLNDDTKKLIRKKASPLYNKLKEYINIT